MKYNRMPQSIDQPHKVWRKAKKKKKVCLASFHIDQILFNEHQSLIIQG